MRRHKEQMQVFIDWLQGGREYMYENAVSVWINLIGAGMEETFATGFLTFVPAHASGQLPNPDHPGSKICDCFQGNLLNTVSGEGHTHLTAVLAEKELEITLENVHEGRIEAVTLKPAPGEFTGNTLVIHTEGDDGLRYVVRFCKRKVLTIPHQLIR